MNSDSNKLLPTYRRLYKTPVKGKRTVISIALDQPKISDRFVSINKWKISTTQ